MYSVVNFRGTLGLRACWVMNVLLVETVELSHFMKSECGYILLGLVMVRPIFHEKWDEKVPR